MTYFSFKTCYAPQEALFTARTARRAFSAARLRLGFSIQQMADACGVHRQTWTKWERGERVPDSAALRLVEVLVFLFDQHLLDKFIKSKTPSTPPGGGNLPVPEPSTALLLVLGAIIISSFRLFFRNQV